MKTTIIYISFILAAATLLLGTGCSKMRSIEGNGNVQIENRSSVSFNFVEKSGPFNVYIIKDTVFYLEIEAESNLIPHIRTTVHGNTLEIDTRENIDNNFAMNIFVHTPVLKGVALSGSGLINLDDFEAEDFSAFLSGSGVIYGNVTANYVITSLSGSGEIDFGVQTETIKSTISGSGRIRISGEAVNAEYRISGSGNIEAYGLPVTDCYANISGSGNVYTTVSDYLDVKISGSGNLFYRGNPTINSNITGSGSIIAQ